MKSERIIAKISQLPLLAGVVLVFLVSCSNDMDKIKFFDKKEMPYQTVKNAEILQSKNGRVQMQLTAPSIRKYTGNNARTEYPEGIFIRFFDATMHVKSSLSSKYAIDWERKNIMQARNNVVIIDYQSGDTTYMETLVWNKNIKKIFTNNPLMSVNGSRVTYGDGFESDDAFENPHIIHQRGTLEWNDDEFPENEE